MKKRTRGDLSYFNSFHDLVFAPQPSPSVPLDHYNFGWTAES